MQTNNKLREALVGLIDGICFHCDLSEDCKGVPCEKMQKAKAALAAPPRNCDVGTAEEQEERYAMFIKEHWTLGKTALQWAQMPYKEGGAK